MLTDMTAVTIQSNKIVLYGTKDNQVLLESSYGKKQMNFLASPILSVILNHAFKYTLSYLMT